MAIQPTQRCLELELSYMAVGTRVEVGWFEPCPGCCSQMGGQQLRQRSWRQVQTAWVLFSPLGALLRSKVPPPGWKKGNLIQLQGHVQGRRVRQKRTGTSLSAWVSCAKRLVALGTKFIALKHNNNIDLALDWGWGLVLASTTLLYARA